MYNSLASYLVEKKSYHWPNRKKKRFAADLLMFVISKSVCSGKSFQPNLMFQSKNIAYPSEAPFRFPTLG